MKTTKPKPVADTDQKVVATLNYQSTADIRTGYLTGLFAAPTPEGSIHVVGYVERKDFPERTIITADPDGQGGIMEDEGGGGWIREIQNSFLINTSAAKALIEILQESLEELQARKVRAKASKEENGKG